MRRLIFPMALLFVCEVIAQEPFFEDVSESAGVKDFGKNYGVSIVDYDNDGDDDIYVSRTTSQANLLYANIGNFRFQEVAKTAGVDNAGSSSHSIWADINNDGFIDLYVANRNDPNALYLNNGDGTFDDITASSQTGDANGAVSTLFGDVDNDGWVDIYVANINAQNVLYRNNGDNTFSDITIYSGAVDELIAMGTTFIDYDNDNDLDLYLSHDAEQANILYQNNGSGVFTNVASVAGVDYEGYGMGTEFADFNNDGFYDIYITNLYENTMFINNQDGTFLDVSASAGVDDYGMGWGVSCLDYNNDGLQDLYAVNNSYFSPYSNVLYQNLGNGDFEMTSEGTSLESKYAGFGVGCGDFDGDGWVDLFVANSGSTGGNQLFRNTGTDSHWITFKMEGTISNRAGIGAKVSLISGETTLMDQVAGGGGYASQNSLTLHFGLKNATKADQVKITWPSGLEDIYTNLEADQHYYVKESSGIEVRTLENTITGLKNSETQLPFVVYPNPTTSNDLIIQMNAPSEQVYISLLTLVGKRTNSTTVLSTNGDGSVVYTIPTDFKNGIYILEVRSENEIFSQRIEVLR